MKSFFRSATALLLLGTPLLLGCSRGADPTSNACERATKAGQDLETAATQYTTSQTRANCEAYKRAANEFLTQADRCADIPRSQIDATRQSIQNITCP
jgi:hypothetical protein